MSDAHNPQLPALVLMPIPEMHSTIPNAKSLVWPTVALWAWIAGANVTS